MIQLLPKELQKGSTPVSTPAPKKPSVHFGFGALIAVVIIIGIAGGIFFFRAQVKGLYNRYFGSQPVQQKAESATPSTVDVKKAFVKTELARSIDEQTGVASEPVNAFTVDDTRYYAIIEMIAPPSGLAVELRWYKDEQFQANYVLHPISRFATFWIDVATRTMEQRRGHYRAEVYFNDTLVNTTEFTVQ